MTDRYYDTIAPTYEELHGDEQRRKLSVLRSSLHITPEDRLLDVGCGTGISTVGFPCQAVGIDPSERLIHIAEAKQSDVTFLVAPAEQIPFPDNSFTVLISLTAVQNFTDRKKAFSEMKRVATPKADIIITCLRTSSQKETFHHAIENYFILKEILEDRKETYFICENV